MESKIKPLQYVDFVEGEGIEEPFQGLSFSASQGWYIMKPSPSLSPTLLCYSSSYPDTQ